VAHYIMLLNDTQITGAFDALNRQIVLILGRFKHPHHERLASTRKWLLNEAKYVPIVFDFDHQAGRTLTETIGAFAHLALFVIADLTKPKSVPQELSHIVPFLPSVPVVPLLPKKGDEYAMFEHFRRYPWVLDPVEYHDSSTLESIFRSQVVERATKCANALREKSSR
jgi:hypothetical protein